MSRVSPNRKGPLLGRSILFGSAYAPAVLIIGCRLIPHWYSWPVIGLGLSGALAWTWFLRRLPTAQPRKVELIEAGLSDTEVTAYIASYLLPILAVPSPKLGDVLAYLLCAGLILVVAFAADLGSVNPIVYFFRLRVVRARDAEGPIIMLARQLPDVGKPVSVSHMAGVVLVLDEEDD